MANIIAYDIGTTGVKTCLYSVEDRIKLLASTSACYGLTVLENGGVEQEPEDWFIAMCNTTKKIIAETNVSLIDGISFCSQMQSLVLVDDKGNAVRRAMSYMDQRATQELKEGGGAPPHIANMNIFRALLSLYITGAAPGSVKDPVWKYKWVEKNEKEIFKKVRWYLDVKEYLIMRLTGNAVMGEDSAFATLLLDTRGGKRRWSRTMCKMLGVNIDHLPKIIKSSDVAGLLGEKAARSLGLNAGIPVFAGGGDASLIAIGAGCTNCGDTHIYNGTSGWVSTVVDKRTVDVNAMIAAIVGAVSGKYNYFAEMETAGKCLEWVRDHLALDEIGIYLKKEHVAEASDALYRSLYDYLSFTVAKAPVGSGGVIFTPYLHGNRCPFEDPNASSLFIGIRLETGKTELIRAVIEGVAYHERWMLEYQKKKVKVSSVIRFCGGGALSSVTAQILADVTGHTIEVIAEPQNVGAMGAAAVASVGLGLISSMSDINKFLPEGKMYYPNMDNKRKYDAYYKIFKNLYKSNKKNYRALEEARRCL